MPSSRDVVLTSYYRPKPGGLCKRLFRAIEALLEVGCEVHYLSVVEFPISHDNCRFHRFPWPKSNTDTKLFWLVFHLLSPVMLLYIAVRYRVTHLFSFSTNYAFLMQPIRAICSLPLSLFLRGDAISSHVVKGRSSWIIKLELFIEAIAIYGVDLYAVSQNLGDIILSRHPTAKPRLVSVLRNNLEALRAKDNSCMSKPLRLASVGVLEISKNHKLIINSVKGIPESDVSLSIYGIGPEEEKLKEMVQHLDLVRQVKFMGWVESEKIWDDIDILLQPSMYEGSPNTVLEAMETQTAILASDIPAHREILSEDSLLDADRADKWRAKIDTIVKNPGAELKNLVDAQRPNAELLSFNWDSAVTDRILCKF